MKAFFYCAVTAVFITACATTAIPSAREGLVEYYGSQRSIFDSGKAEAKVPLTAMSGDAATFGVGAVAGLDGEITVFEGKPYVVKVRKNGLTLDHGTNHSAIFAVWTKQSRWADEPVPAEVKSYLDLQNFVKVRAVAAGIDVSKPFPFLLSGTPAEVTWHINVDRTEGKPITRELFARSKAVFALRNQPMDIVGFHSERHAGVFVSAYAPATKAKEMANAIHIHLLARDGKTAGHIDDILLAGGMTLRLPKS